jgi:hypothetical protein
MFGLSMGIQRGDLKFKVMVDTKMFVCKRQPLRNGNTFGFTIEFVKSEAEKKPIDLHFQDDKGCNYSVIAATQTIFATMRDQLITKIEKLFKIMSDDREILNKFTVADVGF